MNSLDRELLPKATRIEFVNLPSTVLLLPSFIGEATFTSIDDTTFLEFAT